jgi:exopolyphosphatase/guanosine-5'-triphosphate,3'-diphosphate pyrophosphatase
MALSNLVLREGRTTVGTPPAAPKLPRLSISPWPYRPLAAIQIGIEDVALKIVRPIVTGGHETVHMEREPLRDDDAAPDQRADDLVEVLRRYGRACRQHGAIPRAAVGGNYLGRRGGAGLIAHARQETMMEIELVSEREEARLLCRGVLAARPASERVLLIGMDGDTVNLILAAGDQPVALWDLELDRARLLEVATAPSGLADDDAAARLRGEARRIVSKAQLGAVPSAVGRAIAVSGAGRLVRGLAGRHGNDVSASWLHRTNDVLMACWRSDWFFEHASPEAAVLLFRALVLEALVEHLGLQSMRACEAGLLDGMLVDAN